MKLIWGRVGIWWKITIWFEDKSCQVMVFYSMSSYEGPRVKNENTTHGSFLLNDYPGCFLSELYHVDWQWLAKLFRVCTMNRSWHAIKYWRAGKGTVGGIEMSKQQHFIFQCTNIVPACPKPAKNSVNYVAKSVPTGKEAGTVRREAGESPHQTPRSKTAGPHWSLPLRPAQTRQW